MVVLGKVKAKGVAIFGAAQAAGNLDGIELGAETIRAAAERIAKGQAEKTQKTEADAALRAAIAYTAAGRAAG